MADRDVLATPRPADPPTALGGDPDGNQGGATPARPRRWWFGTWAVLFLALAWLQFVVTHRLASGRTPLWAPVDLLPPVLFAAAPVMLLALTPLARPIRPRVAAVVALGGALGAGLSGLNPASLWYTPPPAPADAITVVSWNTEFWDQDWRTAGGHELEPGFYDYLRDLDADVYLLKEYLHIKPADPLVAEDMSPIDRRERLRAVLPGYHFDVNGEQLTISRFPIVGSRRLDMRPYLPDRLRTVPPALADYPSYLAETLRTDVRVNGTVVSFYNTHTGQPPVDTRLHRAATRDANQDLFRRRAASFRALREDLAGNPHPVVVGADLNTSPSMGALRLLPDRLVDHTRAVRALYPNTWLVGGRELWRIDWMLTSDDVAVHSYRLVDPAGLSDHKAQRVVLSTTDG